MFAARFHGVCLVRGALGAMHVAARVLPSKCQVGRELWIPWIGLLCIQRIQTAWIAAGVLLAQWLKRLGPGDMLRSGQTYESKVA